MCKSVRGVIALEKAASESSKNERLGGSPSKEGREPQGLAARRCMNT